jgi:uncharacterized lipoprotein YajG
MPIAKYDVETRTVSGFATLDNIDSQGDVVTSEASQKAFSRFRGNIREMHQPIAVGKLVDFREDEFFDPESQQFYSGIFATAYVSKGAQDTWEKVIDGTLTGFSIGGGIIDSDVVFDKNANAPVRIVKDYELVELSLVDNPANQLANIFSIQKTADGQVLKGMTAETSIENVFWCETDEIAKTSSDDATSCSSCNKPMKNIGWFESGSDRTEKVRSMINELIKSSGTEDNNEGGANMSENTETVETAEAVEEEAVEEVAKAAEVEEGGVNEPDFTKMVDELKTTISEGLEKNQQTTAEELGAIKAQVEEINKSFDTKLSELAAQHAELSEKFAGLNTKHDDVAKRLDGVESKTAVKKSGDVGAEPAETLTKKSESSWGGTFLSVSDIGK